MFFIRLTDVNGDLILVNTNNITAIIPHIGVKSSSEMFMVNGNHVFVKESVESIIDLMTVKKEYGYD